MPSIELKNPADITGNAVLNFWAEWSEPCATLNTVFDQFADLHSQNLKFFKIDAEKFSDVTEKYGVSAVPTFVFLKNGKPVDKVDGANVAELAAKIQINSTAASKETRNDSPVKEDLNTRLNNLVKRMPVMLFMKGTPTEPKCGFSKKIVDILNTNNINFGSFDILSDEEVRNGLKTLFNWPTYPQLYVEGKLIGGLDIVKEMDAEGELIPAIPESSRKEDLNSMLKRLINTAPVMLFMKGSPEEPKCGFSKKIVEILKNSKVDFKSFDILTDEEVRSGLKVYSKWPTFPQLYSKGALVGGLDIVKELSEEGELLSALQ